VIGGGAAGRQHGDATSIHDHAEARLPLDRTLLRQFEPAHGVGHVVLQDRAEPGIEFLLGRPAETQEVAVGVDGRLLHDVRGPDLGSEGLGQLVLGLQQEVAAGRFKQAADGR
jgi:hypothetical protein